MDERNTRRRQPRKKIRLEDANKSDLMNKVESVIIKRLLRIFGVLFILASLFYAVSSADKLIGLAKGLKSSEKVLAPAPAAGMQAAPAVVIPPAETITTILWAAMAGVLVLISLYLSVRFRWREMPRILLPAFYAAVLMLAKQSGWQINILFPLILLFSALLYMNGVKLHSTLVIKANVLLAWTVFGVWWLLKIVLGGEWKLLPQFFVYSGLFFIAFLGTGVHKGFKGHHKSSEYTEVIVAVLNILLFFALNCVVFIKFGLQEYLWLFTLLLGLLILAVIALTDGSQLGYNRKPYLFSGIVLVSLALPLLVPLNFIILFFAVLSVFLMLYAKFSKDQVAVIISLVSMTIMFLAYCQNWIFQYFPASFLGDITLQAVLVKKGLIASLVIIPALAANIYLLKKVEITLSKKWFTRRTYQRLLKGVLLLVIYLSTFWMVNYPLMNLFANDDAKYLSWFACSALFFIISIPVIGLRKSSLLQPMVWFSLILTLAYPLIVHLFVVELRNEFLTHQSFTSTGFYFHYVAVFLLVLNLVVTGLFIPRIFGENKLLVKVIWGYFILMGLFLLLSEFDHLMIVNGLKRGVRIEDIANADKKLPYTLLLMGYSLTLLAAGLLLRLRFLRTIALVIMAGTLLKVLYTDMRSLEGSGRIALLFVLGTATLVISFFYSKIRHLFSRDSHRLHRRHSRHHKTVRP